MLNPIIVIGVGGSGGKTIRSMKQALRRRLVKRGYEGPLPSAWQFVQIDTVHDGRDFPAPMLPPEEVHVVVKPNSAYPEIRQKLESFAGVPEKQRELLSGWLMGDVPVAIASGAGMLRGIGRSVGIADAHGIFEKLNSAATRLASPSALSELQAVAEALAIEGIVDPRPRAMLVSSLSGGSGAGMFLDVAELFKYTGNEPWRRELLSFLYTPEVFLSLGKETADVKKNALGAINEIIAGNWAGASTKSTEFLARQGLPANAAVSQVLGSFGNILIGSTNDNGVDISSGGDGLGMDEVFLTVGEALAGVFVNPVTIEQLYNQILVNIAQRPLIRDESGLSSRRDDGAQAGFKAALPFAGLGFARLTLGVDRAIDFVADALTRAQVGQLLWPDGPRPAPLPVGYTRQQLVAEKVGELWPDFLAASGVNERGNDDQVINALRPEGWKVDATKVATKVVQSAVADRPRAVAQVAQVSWSAWEADSKEFFGSLQVKVNDRAKAWAQQIQKDVRARVADVLSAEGFNVAVSLLDRLLVEVREGGAATLAKEAGDYQGVVASVTAANWASKVADAASGLAGLTSQNTEVWAKLRGNLEKALESQVETVVRDLASRLLRDFADNFLEPLREQVALAREELVTQAGQAVLDNGQKNPLGLFPEWGGAVPQRYQPRSIERTLVKPEEYQELYERYASQDRQMTDVFGTSCGMALRGQPLQPDEQVEQSLVASVRVWVPSTSEARDSGSPAGKARFEIASELLRRGELNRSWLTAHNSSFGKLARMSIAEFVHAGGNAQLRKERENRFADAYGAMMTLAQPLVKLNQGAMKFIKTTSTGLPPDRPQMTRAVIPFDPSDEGNPIVLKCTATLKAAGVDTAAEGFKNLWFSPGSNVEELTVLTASPGGMPAFAFASLTEPIAAAAATCNTNSGLWTQFWQNRRTRPLLEAIPLPRPALNSVITGWLIAKSFGMIDEGKGEIGPRLSIWNPTLATPGRSDFPYPLLAPSPADSQRKWWLPAVLQSIGLAMVDIGQSGSLQPAHAYLLVQYLGREVTTQFGIDTWATPFGDDLPRGVSRKCDLIGNWLSSGQTLINDQWGGFTPNISWMTPEATDVASRKAQLSARLVKVESGHSRYWTDIETLDWVFVPHLWELKQELMSSISLLKQFVQQYSVPEPDADDIQ